MATHPAANAITAQLRLSLGERVADSFDLLDWKGVSGGCIHQSWLVSSSAGLSFFIKTNQSSAFAMFEAEALGLQTISQALSSDNPLRIPEVLAVGQNQAHAWLVLSAIEINAGSPAQTSLGHGLALLHQQQAPAFGFEQHNFIGESPQNNTWQTHWSDFFTEQRLNAQYKLAEQHGIAFHFTAAWQTLRPLIPKILDGHTSQPCLLHGDFWAGNFAYDMQANPYIFDPAVYYGDPECDLAMSALFGGFETSFYAAYHEVIPQKEGYAQRKKLYNLYHVLNHANLFGGAYIGQSIQMMQELNVYYGD
ncbi:MAG: fructosamine kinase family protein [Mariprofundaceae bacterium]|nr:fructosamine kinase family protein [Mariprofundaceae bacterium]